MCRNKGDCHACHPHSVKFRHWAWYEWLTAAVFIVALGYALYGIISICILMTPDNKPDDDDGEKIVLIRFPPMSSIVYLLLFAHFLLFLAAVLGLLWLTYLRNMCIFLLTFVILVVAIVIYIIVGAALVYAVQDETSLNDAIYNQIKDNIKKMKYELAFFAFQREHKCCGVRDYADWNEFSKVDAMTMQQGNLPDSCCIERIHPDNCGAGLLVLPKEAKAVKTIVNREGCISKLKESLYGGAMSKEELLAIECFIVAIFLLALICLLLYICHRLYLHLVRLRFDRGGDEWDDEEDEDSWKGEGGQGNEQNGWKGGGGQGNEQNGWKTGTGQGNDASGWKGEGGQGIGENIRGGGQIDNGNGTIGPSRTGGDKSQSGKSSILRRSRSRKGRGRSRSSRDRDDDRESYIVPGTPAKSMISDDEQTFYAP